MGVKGGEREREIEGTLPGVKGREKEKARGYSRGLRVERE